MNIQTKREQIWQTISKEIFAVLGMVTVRGEARTVAIVYVVFNEKLYIGSQAKAWKAKHIAANEAVSLTIPVAKRVPFLPWIKIPAATISFAGRARIYRPEELPTELLRRLFRNKADDAAALTNLSVIEVTPVGDFLTYGVGVPLLAMRDPARARGRVPVAGYEQSVRDVK